MTEAAYRAGALAGRHRAPIRIWLRADLLFAEGEMPDGSQARQTERMKELPTEDGRVRLDRAMAEVLRYPADTRLIVEGDATGATRDERYWRARQRATQVLAYVRARFGLSGERVTTMALDAASGEGAEGRPRDAIGLAVWVDRRVLANPAAH